MNIFLPIYFFFMKIFALLLQIFALLFGINCTEIDQSQSRNLCLRIIHIINFGKSVKAVLNCKLINIVKG